MPRKKAAPSPPTGSFERLLNGTHEQRERVFRAVVESLGEGLVVTDRENRILFVNERTVELSRYRREQLLGAKTREVFLTPDQWAADTHRLNARLDGQSEVYEVEQLCGDGSLRWFEVRATPFRDESGAIVGTIGVILDIEHRKRLENENELLQEELRRHLSFGSIIGSSSVMRKCLEQVRLVAPTDANVLVLGESGTGKELIARAIHDLSSRRNGPMVRVNCASIPRELFESEFFGHVRGAFTGAVKDRVGRFELADGGTLFLDEIGEISPEQQSKLLRVLQEGTFERVGEDRTRSVNVRIIAATNRDLLAESNAGRFRRDLYYRLSVFPIEVPPLHERGNDVIELAQVFIERAAQKLRVPVPKLTQAQGRELLRYPWPGNVRELQHVIERAVILSKGGRQPIHLEAPEAVKVTTQIPHSLPIGAFTDGEGITLRELKDQEREILLQALRKTRWRVYGPNGAAAILDLPPTTMYHKMRKHGLERHGSVFIAERAQWE